MIYIYYTIITMILLRMENIQYISFLMIISLFRRFEATKKRLRILLISLCHPRVVPAGPWKRPKSQHGAHNIIIIIIMIMKCDHLGVSENWLPMKCQCLSGIRVIHKWIPWETLWICSLPVSFLDFSERRSFQVVGIFLTDCEVWIIEKHPCNPKVCIGLFGFSTSMYSQPLWCFHI